MSILRFFGFIRLVPHEFYSFYNYTTEVTVTRRRPSASRRTLELLRRFMGHLLLPDYPNAFSPRTLFPESEEYY